MQDKGFKGINFYEDELNDFREHPNVADVPTLVTALEHAYEVLTTHEAIIKIFCTVFEKMEDYYHARLELGEALRTIEKVTWEACMFVQIVREQKGHTPDGGGAPTDRSD